VRGVRVVDARGGDAGWRLALGVDGIGRRRALVSVVRVVATAESIDGIRAVRHAAVASDRSRTILHARHGSGRGAFDVTFTIDVDRLPASSAPVVSMRFDLS
jgi:hypothetical protein